MSSPRVFAYCRVSTTEQTTDNQAQEIAAAGFAVNPRRVVRETVSGSQAAMQRPQFAKLMDRLETGDVLVVTKLDRLGRSALDVRMTVDRLAETGVRVHCLALGGADLTSSTGKLTMQVLAAVAEFELDLIRERTSAGLDRVRAEGKHLGRPSALTPAQTAEVRARLASGGGTVSSLAREFGVGRATIQRAQTAATPGDDADAVDPMAGIGAEVNGA